MFRSKDSQGKVKYVGTSKAKVLDDRDPLSRGRILVDHSLLGNTSWIPYLSTPGSFTTPAIGDLVYVQCDSGEPEYAYAWGNVAKGEKANADIPARFKRTVPTNRGFYTPGGNFIEMDDGEAKAGSDPKYSDRTSKNRGIRITSTSGHTISIFDDPDNGTESITILDKSGDGLVFDSKNKEVTLVSKGKLNITADDTVNITANKDMQVNVPNDQELHNVKDFNVQASGVAQIQAGDAATFNGQSMTTVGSSGSPTKVDGQVVELAGGGPGVARLGDRAFGIGNLGAPVSSTIIQGSFKVTSG